MFRRLTALLALAIVVACVSAKEYKGNATKIDTDKKTITVKVGDDEKKFSYNDKTEFSSTKFGKIPQENLSKFASKLAEKARPVTVVTEEKDGKEVMHDGNPVANKITIGKQKEASKD